MLLVRSFPLFGSIIILRRGDSDIALSELEILVRRYRATLVKLDFNLSSSDPRAEALLSSLSRLGYSYSHLSLCPTKTIEIDTRLAATDLMRSFSRGVRRYLKEEEEQPFVLYPDRTIREFYPVLREASRRNHYPIESLKDMEDRWGGFGNNLKVLIGYYHGEVIGGAVVVCQGPKAFGLYMASTDRGKELNLPYSLMWESFLLAKNAGCSVFDLDGVYDERHHEPSSWKGLSAFKEKFGGRPVEMVGTFVKCRYGPTRLLTYLRII